MRTKKQYQEELNELGPCMHPGSFVLGGKLRKGLYGNLLRKYDPIAFEVGFREWRDNNDY